MIVGGHSNGLPNFVSEINVELPPPHFFPSSVLFYLRAGLFAP